MQQEILFRGKVNRDRWAEGFLFELSYNGASMTCIGCEPLSANDYSEIYESCYDAVYPETVGQYTGLKDKNGVKAFEDDMIHKIYSDGQNTVFSIEWNDKLLAWVANNGIDEPELLCNVWDDTCEIIGNIHDKKIS